MPVIRSPIRSPIRSAIRSPFAYNYGAGAAAFTPASLYTSGQLGAWYDPSDLTTLFQDSAGTTAVTAVTQPVGKALDKSGRSNHLSQATASARPLLGTTGAKYLTFDGIDDGLSTGALTLGADMDCFIALRRNSTASGVLAFESTAASYFGVVQAAGGAALADGGVGSPTYSVNGTALNGGATGTTRVQLDAAMPIGNWCVVEVKDLNLSVGWASFALGNYPGFALNGDIAGIVLAPAGDATSRQKIRTYLGAKVGLSL